MHQNGSCEVYINLLSPIRKWADSISKWTTCPISYWQFYGHQVGTVYQCSLLRRHCANLVYTFMADSRLASSQWETSLQSNAVSHWLGANLESALYIVHWYTCTMVASHIHASLIVYQGLQLLFDDNAVLVCIINVYLSYCDKYGSFNKRVPCTNRYKVNKYRH